MKSAIVTGANGFLGSLLIKKLVAHDIKVIALDLSFDNSRVPNSHLVTKIESELLDVAELLEKMPMGGYDAFYHFAWKGINGVDKGNPFIQLKNGEVAMTCATVAKELGCKRFLCSGTVAEHVVKSLSHLEQVDSGILYGVAKHAVHLMLEAYCKNIGLKLIWMQFSNVYGPTNKTGNIISYTIGELAKGKTATFGSATQPYDFVYVEDLIEAVYRLGEKDSLKDFYFIGSGKPRPLKEYLIEIGEKSGKAELISFGVRPDDGIVYTLDMFDVETLKNDIGDYVSKDFSEGIIKTIENYR